MHKHFTATGRVALRSRSCRKGPGAAFTRGLCALIATTMILSGRTAIGSPGDIFSISAPAIGDAPPTTAAIADGESGVATSTGAFTYSYPIAAPPGRNGMRPSISLSYSSQGAIYGGIAAGWALSGLPLITEDTSGGRLWRQPTVAYPTQAPARYASSLAGNRPLIAFTDPAPQGAITYRAQNDSTWVRYERYTTGGYWWRALSPEGTTYYFGHKDSHTSSCTIISDGYAPVTRIEDSFGNQVDFYYQPGVSGECRISEIRWGQNTSGANSFARMTFTWSTPTPVGCAGPVGGQTSYRTGTKIVIGASKLDAIETFAFEPSTFGSIIDHHRTITLTYADSSQRCDQSHAPYRALTKIDERAVGTDAPEVVLPSIDFTYGDAAVSYGASTQATPPWSSANTGFPPAPTAYNLGWGFRPHNGGWPTVEAMMLDVDGDGLIDRVQSEPYVENGHTRFCQARWYRNPGGGGAFLAAGYIPMPTLKWASLTPYAGGAYATEYTSTGANERCALNYQRTGYSNSAVNYTGTCNGNPTCSVGQDGVGVCAGTHTDCGNGKQASDQTYFAWRWMDIDGDQLPDLVGSPVQGGIGSYDLQHGNLPTAVNEPAIFGTFPGCPWQSYSSSNAWAADPYTMCHGMFPWFVYKNHGNGVFGIARPGGQGTTHATWGPLPDQIMYQPLALESSTGDASVTSRPVSQTVGFVDIDGDGLPDGVSNWNVYRNDGTGQLVAIPYERSLSFPDVVPYTIPTQPNVWNLTRSDLSSLATPTPIGTESVDDINGDGLADHWLASSQDQTQAVVNWNDGQTFLSAPSDVTQMGRPGTDGFPTIDTSAGAPTYYVCRGSRRDSRRTVDVDLDGRPDLITSLLVQYSLGAGFGAATTQIGTGGPAGVQHTIQVRTDDQQSPCSGMTEWWETLGDLIDLDGDGIKEDVLFSNQLAYVSPNQMFVRRRSYTAPPRLMVSIDNHRGASTTITYSSMTGAAVTQSPAAAKSSPGIDWVVASLTTTDSFAATTATTTYQYKNPRWTKDLDVTFAKPSAFRGFEQVTSTSPSGMRTIQRYDFAIDPSGRLSETVVMPKLGSGEGDNDARTIERTTWSPRCLPDTECPVVDGLIPAGVLKTYHATVSEHLTCSNDQTDPAAGLGNPCTPASASGYTRTTSTFSPRNSTAPTGSTYLLWYESQRLLQSGPTVDPADGDRTTSTTYALAADDVTYRFRPLITTKQVRASGNWVDYAKSAATWDSTFRMQLTDEEWFDSNDSNRAVSRSEYDPLTGNLLKRWKPNQNNAGTTYTNYVYDSRQLFPASETNELGHFREFTWEYGTGTKLETNGPNVRGCITGPGCPADATHPLKQQNKIRVDGLGRMIERWESFSGDGYLYLLYKVETNEYVDTITAGTRSILHKQLLDIDGIVWKQDKTELDGQGRVIKQTVYVQGSAPADQVTSYFYNPDSTLANVIVPDPNQNSGSSNVTYSYTYDSLGRPKSLRRPDGSPQSGVDMAYDGVFTTTTEVTGGGGGQVAVTKTENDRFGRLIRVHEKTGTSTWAITNYTYDARNLVNSVTDPQLFVTAMAHDFAGRRTQITRAGRSWTLTYDRNGNAIAEKFPGSPGSGSDYLYTNTTAYDDLDRPTSKIFGSRALSTADQAAFGNNSEVFTYDIDTNMKGRLRAWNTYGPTSIWSVGMDLRADIQGNPTGTILYTQLPSLPQLSRWFFETWYASGTRQQVRHGDLMGAGTWDTWTQTYLDPRGLPSYIDIFNHSWTVPPTVQSVAEQTRNVAGLVTKRKTNNVGGTGYVESNWTYDKIGRVTDQTVQKGPTLSTVARQTLTYHGADDPKTLVHVINGGSSKTFTFGYDLRHELTTVTTNTSSYYGGTFGYGTAGRLSTANVSQTGTPPAGTEVKTRNVNYVYGDADPERVTALTNVSNGSRYATFTYDAAGNITWKCMGTTFTPTCTGESFDYVYDGKDQLRRATRKVNNVIQGSEEYWYDKDGQRVAIVKKNASGTKTELVEFLKDTEAHYNGSGVLTHIYSHASMGTPVARVDRTADTVTSTEVQFHGLAGNTLTVVDRAAGTVNADFRYGGFGEVLESNDVGGAAAHRRRFNDKQQDELTSLAYYGARYYDKVLIGWTQGDPLFRLEPDAAWNQPRKALLYAAHLNNPLRYIDPDGRQNADVLSWAQAVVSSTAEGLGWGTLAGVYGPAFAAVVLPAVADNHTGVQSPVTHEESYDRQQMAKYQREQLAAQQQAIDKSIAEGMKTESKTETDQSGTRSASSSKDANVGPGSEGQAGSGAEKQDKPPRKRSGGRSRANSGPCTSCGAPNSANVPNPKTGKRTCADCYTKDNGKRPTGEDYAPDGANTPSPNKNDDVTPQ